MSWSRCSAQTSSGLRIEPSFYVFWAIFCLLDSEQVLPIFLLAAVIHELGHLLAIRLCGGTVKQIVLSASGVVIQQGTVLCRWKSLCISAAGPLAGLLAAICFALFGNAEIVGANLILSCLNLLPILPLDGGCMLYYLIEGWFPAAEMVLQWLSFFFAVMLTAFGGVFLFLTGRNAALLVIGLCLLRNTAASLRTQRKYGMMKPNHIIRS